MTLVREDEHGLYVKVGGYIARPQLSRWVKGRTPAMPTCRKDDHVRTTHKGGPTARVDGQTWFTHDSYFGGRWGESAAADKPSEQCWAPAVGQVDITPYYTIEETP